MFKKDGIVCMEKGDRFVLVCGEEEDASPALKAMGDEDLPRVRIVEFDPRQGVNPLEATVVEIITGRVVVDQKAKEGGS